LKRPVTGSLRYMRAAGIVLVVLGFVLFFVVGPYALPVGLVGLLVLGLALAASRRAVKGNARAADPTPDMPDTESRPPP
jgi:hypothetical protein